MTALRAGVSVSPVNDAPVITANGLPTDTRLDVLWADPTFEISGYRRG